MAPLISLHIIGALLGSVAVSAAGDEAIWGAGRASCMTWNNALKNDHHIAAALAEWVSGYVSADNQKSGARAHLTDLQVDNIINGWLHTYCEQHPADLISDAAQALVAERKKH